MGVQDEHTSWFLGSVTRSDESRICKTSELETEKSGHHFGLKRFSHDQNIKLVFLFFSL